uniref:Uncharacterized protein n=1 Tax=Rhizophora mucronata TaxID=61149 RepID=A0A2P2L654_RHIMU
MVQLVLCFVWTLRGHLNGMMSVLLVLLCHFRSFSNW